MRARHEVHWEPPHGWVSRVPPGFDSGSWPSPSPRVTSSGLRASHAFPRLRRSSGSRPGLPGLTQCPRVQQSSHTPSRAPVLPNKSLLFPTQRSVPVQGFASDRCHQAQPTAGQLCLQAHPISPSPRNPAPHHDWLPWLHVCPMAVPHAAPPLLITPSHQPRAEHSAGAHPFVPVWSTEPSVVPL